MVSLYPVQYDGMINTCIRLSKIPNQFDPTLPCKKVLPRMVLDYKLLCAYFLFFHLTPNYNSTESMTALLAVLIAQYFNTPTRGGVSPDNCWLDTVLSLRVLGSYA